MNIRLKAPFSRRVLRTLARLVFRWTENNDDERIAHNGEQWLLRQLLAAHVRRGEARPFVLFDVGANCGDYVHLALQEARRLDCPVEVHAFEPSPVAMGKLRRLLAGEKSVRLVETALTDSTGEAPLFAGGSGSRLASLVARATPGLPAEPAVKVRTQRLDDYLTQANVARVDLLKLDVEGAELTVLHGLGERLGPSTIDVIQLEYGGATRDARVTLHGLEAYVAGHGYALAKLFPRALEVRVYREWMDNYSYANYVALAPRWLPPNVGS